MKQTGPVSYRVQGTDRDITYRRHGDQLRSRVAAEELDLNTDCTPADLADQPTSDQPSEKLDMPADDGPLHMDSEVPAASPDLRRSGRDRKPPERYVP